MAKWKYAVINIPTPDLAPEMLNKAGQEGWELVSVIKAPSSNQTTVYLKKPE